MAPANVSRKRKATTAMESTAKKARLDAPAAKPAPRKAIKKAAPKKVAVKQTTVAPTTEKKVAAPKKPAKKTNPLRGPKKNAAAPKDAVKTGRVGKAKSAPVPKYRDAPKEPLAVYVFGEGSAGELGLGTKRATDVKAPRRNPNLDGITAIATGGMHAAALTADNRVLTWGVNDEGALGRPSAWEGGLRDVDDEEEPEKSDDEESDSGLNPRESNPTAIPSDSLPTDLEIVQIAAGDSTTFVLMSDGSVYGWGSFRDSNGPYGFTIDPKTKQIVIKKETAYRIPELSKIVSLSVGTDFALALDVNGVAYAWGPGQQDQLGHRVIERRRAQALLPNRLPLPKKVKVVSIHAGNDHAFAIDSNGDTWAWGANSFGQTGIAAGAGNDNATVGVPTKVPSLVGKKMKSVSGGRHHSMGLTQSGQLLAWGRTDMSQLGLDMSRLPTDQPKKVVLDDFNKPRILLEPTPLDNVGHCVLVSAGPDQTIAVNSEGKAFSWGFSSNYQTGQGTEDDIPIAKLMNGKAIRDTKLTWAGCGGQFSMLAAPLAQAQDPASAPAPVTTSN